MFNVLLADKTQRSRVFTCIATTVTTACWLRMCTLYKFANSKKKKKSKIKHALNIFIRHWKQSNALFRKSKSRRLKFWELFSRTRPPVVGYTRRAWEKTIRITRHRFVWSTEHHGAIDDDGTRRHEMITLTVTYRRKWPNVYVNVFMSSIIKTRLSKIHAHRSDFYEP